MTETNGETFHGPERRHHERRQDFESRKRIVELEARYRWLAKKVLLAVGGLGLGIVLGFAGTAYLYNQIQDSRREQTERSCLQRNDDRRAIKRFVVAQAGLSIPATPEFNDLPDNVKRWVASLQQDQNLEQLNSALDQEFPIEPDCRAYAKRVIDREE
jgi:hypothetical protein